MVTKAEVQNAPMDKLQKLYTKYSRDHVYNYEEHVQLANDLDSDGRLPATYMVVAPASWSDEVWDDINRMRTLNTNQSRRKKTMHVCPLQIDIVERIINRYSNPGDTVFDPFAGLFTVPYIAALNGRFGIGTELNADYFRDGVGYLKTTDENEEEKQMTLFDLIDVEGA